jgi:L-fuconolactonase
MQWNRRNFLFASAAALAAGSAVSDERSSIPCIDSHIHLWDLTRPQGAPYPAKGMKLPGARGKMMGTEHLSATVYHQEFASPGVAGAIAAEASPWLEDNLWLLESCADDDFMVGAVGNLRPEAKEFPEYLDRYHKNPLYLGIRYGNLWGYNLAEQSSNPAFINGLKLLAQAGLVLDVGNPEISVLQATLRVNDAVPSLKIVAEHLVGFSPAPEATAAYELVLREFQHRPQIYGKVGIIAGPSGEISPRLADHRPDLDRLHEAFGEDRVVGYAFSNISPGLELMKQYYAAKSRQAAEKFFWKNSVAVYHWAARTPEQPRVA